MTTTAPPLRNRPNGPSNRIGSPHGARSGSRRRMLPALLGVLAAVTLLASPAQAAVTVTPLTWGVVGLDSNNVNIGPSDFPVGARVCTDVAATNVQATFIWDSVNPYIANRPGTLTVLSVPSLAANTCTDFYFEIRIARDSAAYGTSRRFHIGVTADGGITGSTPTPREIYVERLISQSRNTVTDLQYSSDNVTYTSVAEGGAFTLLVNNTYWLRLVGATATNGYEQIETFLNISNVVFQILSVATTYTAGTPTDDKPYGDACTWDANPLSFNYRSCIGTGKSGGDITVTYQVRILSVPPAGNPFQLQSLIYDFSGSSYHYNAEYPAIRDAYIIDPSTMTVSKSFVPASTTPGGTSVLTISIPNPSAAPLGGVSISDTLPTSPAAMVVAPVPNASTSGCGGGVVTASPGAGSISLTGATIPGGGTCVVRVSVTAPLAGTYTNTTNNLFIGSLDTGKSATANLNVAPNTLVCTDNVTMAQWTVPSGASNPPDAGGSIAGAGTPGNATIRALNVATATTRMRLTSDSNQILAGNGFNDTFSWETDGYKTSHGGGDTFAGTYAQFVVNTKNYSEVDFSFYLRDPSPANGPTLMQLSYSTDGVNFTNLPGGSFDPRNDPSSGGSTAWTLHGPYDFTGLTSTTGNTTFRITGTGANNETATVLYDLMTFSGCSFVPRPTLSKAFNVSPIVVGGTSLLTFSLANGVHASYDSMPLTDVNFTDTLPTGLLIDTSTAPSTTCVNTGGNPLVLTAVNNTTAISLTGAELTASGAGSSCTVTVRVKGVTAGSYTNQSGFISGFVSGTQYTNSTATGFGTASILVIAPPVIAKAFGDASIFTGSNTSLTLTVTNPNVSQSLTGVAFTDSLPGGLVVASPNGLSSTCSGTTTATAGSGSVSLSGATLAGLASCTITLDVTGATVGLKNNSVQVTSTEGGTGNTALASVLVEDQTPAISLLKQVGPSPTGPWTAFLARNPGQAVYYQFTVENVGDVTLTSIGLTDPNVNVASCTPALPASLPPAPGASTASCVVGPVTAGPANLYVNTATVTGTFGATTVNDTSSATYSTSTISLLKVATEIFFSGANEVINYGYTVAYTSSTGSVTGPITIADDKATVTCPAVNTIGDNDANFEPGESMVCTATYVTTASDVSAGQVTNTATATAANGGAAVSSNTVSETVPLAGPVDLAVTKTDGVTELETGSSTTYTLVFTNNGPNTVGAVIKDPAVTGLTKTAVGSCSASGGAVCPTVTIAGLESAGGISIASFPPGGSISFTVTATISATTSPVVNTATITNTSLIESSTADNTASDSDSLAQNFGHLPSSYMGMNLLPTGARTLSGTTFLGAGKTTASDGINTPTYTNKATDDGVTWTPGYLWDFGPGGSSGSGGSLNFTVTCPVNPCYLNAWIDWNADSDFNDADEKLFVDNRTVTNGTNTLTFTIPAGALLDGITPLYARFRLTNSPMGTPSPSGQAVSGGGVPLVGEIEDFFYKLTPDSVPTPVTVAFFRTRRGDGHTVFFRWSTATETANLGFNLYVEKDGELVRINDQIILSKSIDSLDRTNYAYRAEVEGDTFFIEDVSIHAERRRHGPFRLERAYGGQLQDERVKWAEVRAEHEAAAAAEQAEIVSERRATWASASTEGSTVLLEVRKTGIHRVTYEALVNAGVTIPGGTSKLFLYSRDGQVPIYSPAKQFGPGAFFEFYGEAIDTLYTDANVYSLRIGGSGSPKSIQEVNGTPDLAATFPATYTETFVLDRNRAYAQHSPGAGPWYDTSMLTFNTVRNFDFSFQVEGLADPSAPATLELVTWGITGWLQNPDHHLQAALNGVPVLDERFDGPVEKTWRIALPSGALQSANTLRLTLAGDTGAPWDIIYFVRLKVDYQRAFLARDGRLAFTGNGPAYQVGNLPSSDVVVYRIEQGKPARLKGVRVQPASGGFAASFSSPSSGARNVVSTVGALHTPSVRLTSTRSDLDREAQYLVIAHPAFISGVQPLVAARERQGLTVNVVDVNDIYARYSGGIFDPQAIKSYIAFAATTLGTRSVLLVGGDMYDYRNYLGRNGVSFIPSIYATTGPLVNFVPSDAAYADLDDNGAPDLAIGRFPVRTTAELDMIVAKTLAYQTKAYGRTALFAADRRDGGLSFKNYNSGFMSTLPPGWSSSTVNLDDLDVTTARTNLKAAMNQGTAMVTFTGHSGPREWTFSNLFTSADASALTNAGRPFVAVQWGCWNTYYVDPVHTYLVQSFLFSGDRGAAAVLGAATLTDAGSEYLLGRLLTPRLATPGVSIGAALLEAKRELATTHPHLADVLIGWTLMGDPELVIEP